MKKFIYLSLIALLGGATFSTLVAPAPKEEKKNEDKKKEDNKDEKKNNKAKQ
jgi:hypothetical protein